MKDETKKLKLYTRRAIVLGGIKAFFLATTIARFYYLQVVDGMRYKVLSNKNRIRVIPIFPKRGSIFDTNGLILAKDIASFDLVKEEVDNSEMLKLSSILELDSERVGTLSDKFIYRNLSWKELSKVATHKSFLEGFKVVEKKKRIYPTTGLAGHITGYITKDKSYDKSTRKFLQEIDIGSFTKGIAGVESSLEQELKGKIGKREIEVNAKNRFIRQIRHESGVSGQDVSLSIDMRLQELADKIIGEREGWIVVQKIETGEVICMYSKPSYDPNMFINGISYKDWDAIREDPGKPLLNKVISGIFPPGSAFKLVTALAALRAGFDPEVEFECTGRHKVGNRFFHCWNRLGHGKVNLSKAIQKSCNVYFYNVSEIIGMDKIQSIAESLNLGQKTNIELPGEVASLIPSKDWKKRKFAQHWLKGDTINASVGQGYVTFTPIGINTMISRLASGKMVQSTILKTEQDDIPSFKKLIDIPQKHLKIVTDNMYLATNKLGGSTYSSRLGIKGFELCGKSGTAQVASIEHTRGKRDVKKGLQDHSIFAGFAPYKNPTYAITVILEHSNWGSRAAAPAAKAMMKHIYELYHSA